MRSILLASISLMLSIWGGGVAWAQTTAASKPKVASNGAQTPSTSVKRIIEPIAATLGCYFFDPMGTGSQGSVLSSTTPQVSLDGSCGPFILAQESRWVYDWTASGTQRIVITGRRLSNGWRTACVGEDCRDFLDDLFRPGSTPHPNPILEGFIRYSDVREISADACQQVGLQPTDEGKNQVANTTSRSNANDRSAAAKQVWAQSSERRAAIASLTSLVTTTAYGANGGFGFTLTFSDGGSELYNIRIGDEFGESFEAVSNSLKQGTGTSRCPR
jgi:hypothetical protein